MLAPCKKSYVQPRQHIKKQRHYFADKGPSSQSCGFSSSDVWMWELVHNESWVLKNRCFWTVVLDKTLESPWTARRSSRSILEEINPEYSLEGLMLKLKLQYSGHLMQKLTHWKRPSCWERLKAGGEVNNRGWHGWIAPLTQWTWVWANSGSWWWTGRPGVLQSMGLQRVGHNLVTELNWMPKRYHFKYTNATTKNSVLQKLECRAWRQGVLPVISSVTTGNLLYLIRLYFLICKMRRLNKIISMTSSDQFFPYSIPNNLVNQIHQQIVFVPWYILYSKHFCLYFFHLQWIK